MLDGAKYRLHDPFFTNQGTALLKILKESNLPQKEKEYREKQIERSLAQTKATNKNYDLFFQRAHEIESLHFLSSFGNVSTALDSQSVAGADFILNNEIYIECVCSSTGNIEKTGFSEYMGEGIFDYTKERQLINARFTGSLREKVKFYNNHVGSSIPHEKPYIIFLSPGRLAMEWFEGEYGLSLTDILFGRGQPTFSINKENGSARYLGYSHIDKFKKNNGADIDSNIFQNTKFECVSGILLATRIGERYSNENVFLFLNPFAKIKVDESIFDRTIYWNMDQGGYYRPYLEGNIIEVD